MPGNKKSRLQTSTLLTITSLALMVLALGLRFSMTSFTNIDTNGYVRWYDYIVQQGIPGAMRQNFAIYTPPYLYLLSLATLTRDFVPKLLAIKTIPILFDCINAVIVWKIVRLKFSTGPVSLLAAAIFMLMPTIMINSALWGQIDALYTCFLLITVYFVLTERPILAMIAFGLSASVKAQAAFLIPFLLVMAFKKRIPWYTFFLVPLVYFAAMLPAVFAGRPIMDVMTIYLNQASEFKIPSFNSPNWYIFVPQHAYSTALPIGLGLTILAIGLWVGYLSHRDFTLEKQILIFTALVSTALTPFLLPKMHDRYFYPADVFSLLLAFYSPQLWFIAAAYQVVSTLAYSIFLFGAPRQIPLMLATELNTALIAYLLWKQHKITQPITDAPKLHEVTVH